MFATKLGEKVIRGISDAYQLGSKAYGYIKPVGVKATKSFGGAYDSPIASMAMSGAKLLLPDKVVSALEGANRLYNQVAPAMAMGRRVVGLAQNTQNTRSNSIEMRKNQSRSANAIPHVSAKKDQARPVQLGSSRPQIRPTPKYRSGRF